MADPKMPMPGTPDDNMPDETSVDENNQETMEAEVNEKIRVFFADITELRATGEFARKDIYSQYFDQVFDSISKSKGEYVNFDHVANQVDNATDIIRRLQFKCEAEARHKKDEGNDVISEKMNQLVKRAEEILHQIMVIAYRKHYDLDYDEVQRAYAEIQKDEE
ncbi:MAG: hypothetical protein WCW66_01015 [Patescibacteria group bacterium]